MFFVLMVFLALLLFTYRIYVITTDLFVKRLVVLATLVLAGVLISFGLIKGWNSFFKPGGSVVINGGGGSPRAHVCAKCENKSLQERENCPSNPKFWFSDKDWPFVNNE